MQAIGGLPEESVAELLARAFVSNPLNLAVVGRTEKARYRANLHGMRSLLGAARQGAEVRVAVLGDEPVAVLVGVPPEAYPLPPPPVALQLRAVLGQGPRILGRWAQVYDRLQLAHPVAPHAYLGILGVDPEQQRRGYGAALLADWLRSVDEASLASYLETDRQSNVEFYARAGFEVQEELEVLGVRVFCMGRAARADNDRGGMLDVRTPK